MNPIELSCRQSERLLEMCKELFPEYKEIYWNSGKGSNGSSEHLGFGTPEKDNPHFTEFIYIHWFEFCITKLYNEFKRRAIDVDLYFFTLNPEHCQWPKEYNHPIDYLYFKFKQLKSC